MTQNKHVSKRRLRHSVGRVNTRGAESSVGSSLTGEGGGAAGEGGGAAGEGGGGGAAGEGGGAAGDASALHTERA